MEDHTLTGAISGSISGRSAWRGRCNRRAVRRWDRFTEIRLQHPLYLAYFTDPDFALNDTREALDYTNLTRE